MLRRKRVSPREAKRMMQRMGLSMGEMPDVQEVILRTSTKEIVVENPEVALLEMHGQKIFQVTGGKITEKEIEHWISDIKQKEIGLGHYKKYSGVVNSRTRINAKYVNIIR